MIPSNAIADVFHPGTDWTSAPPDVPGVPVLLRPRFIAYLEQGEEGTSDAGHYTHLGLVAATVDVRDGYQGSGQFSPQGGGMLFVAGTQYEVMFVGRRGRGTALDHKRLYLRRRYVPWPALAC